jgi:hypothetical protein
MNSFWDFFWLILVSFAFVAYLQVMFSIFADLFRDHHTSGFVKALWIVFLFVIPFLSALVYVIVRGDGMAKRSMGAAQQARQAQEGHIRDVAGKSSAEQITDAKALLDSGTITAEEYQTLEAKALSPHGV